MERIAAAACGDRAARVVEIGPGKGALTAKLLPRADRVIALEIDAGLVEVLRARFAGEPNLTIEYADALTTDFAALRPSVIVGNLPYYAATAIMERTLAFPCVYLIQKEVALRLAAAPGDRDYGYLSVRTQIQARVELLFEVKPAAFHPPPKVDSAVVRLTPRDRSADLEIGDASDFLRFAAMCFRQKRKTLRNNLTPCYPKASVDALPQAGQRAEQLSLEDLAALYRALR